ncbi:MAG: hypothetical protein PHT33_08820 [bacterium]|nr:hypothetical protein [bacterium]
MPNSFIVVVIVILFYLLGKAADLITGSVKEASGSHGARVFIFGILLGLFTSLPELVVAINAFIDGVPLLSIGNLLGGIVVLFGLVLGTSVFLGGGRDGVSMDIDTGSMLAAFAYMVLPLLLSLDGVFDISDGFILLVSYLTLLSYLYRRHRKEAVGTTVLTGKAARNYFLAIIGTIAVIILADAIVRLIIILISNYRLSQFVTGLIILSLGTNLPELTIALKSSIGGAGELSLGGITGSALANVLIIGLFSSIRSINVNLDTSYYLLIITMLIMFATIMLFRKQGKCLSRYQGAVIVLLYAIFFASQTAMLIRG